MLPQVYSEGVSPSETEQIKEKDKVYINYQITKFICRFIYLYNTNQRYGMYREFDIQKKVDRVK